MQLGLFDIGFFLAFIVVVVAFAMYKSRRERSSEDYFLAGRGLTWPLIGLSIVAANISTEQLVGMAGQGAGNVGLAVSGWQLTGAIGIVIIAFTFLPRFLQAGVYTMPEFLEYRYNSAARAIMAVMTVVIYVAVLLTAVLYSGGLTLRTIFGIDLTLGIWGIGVVAALYTTWGGLKAVAWADLIQGLALLGGGLLTFLLGLHACGGWTAFAHANADRLHMVLPADHPQLPWTGIVSGMWIVIIYYCGLNQFIVQRNLAARTLRDGQLGMVFAAGLWLLVPFAIVMPGMMALQIYPDDLAREADQQNAQLMKRYALGEGDIVPERWVAFSPDQEWERRHADQLADIAQHNRRVQELAEQSGATVTRETLIGRKYDAAFPVLIKRLIPPGLRGVMLAAIAGAVISSLASMLNSASTIFTLDVYHRLFDRQASQTRLVILGRVTTMMFVVIGCLLAPALDNPEFGGVFQFIQEFQGYIWPGVVAAFVIAFVVPRAPGAAAVAALISGPVIYGLLQRFSGIHFLIQVLLAFVIVCAIMVVITLARPLQEPRQLPVRSDMQVENSRLAMGMGVIVIMAVVAFYCVFW